MLLTLLAASCNKPEPEPEPSGPEVKNIELKLPFLADTTSVEIEGIDGYTFGTVPKWLEIKQNKEGIELITKENGEKDIEEVSAKVMLTSEEKTIELDITKGGYPTFDTIDSDVDTFTNTMTITMDEIHNASDILVISLYHYTASWEILNTDDKKEVYDNIMGMVQETDYPHIKHLSDFEGDSVSIYYEPRKMYVLMLAADENHYVGKSDLICYD